MFLGRSNIASALLLHKYQIHIRLPQTKELMEFLNHTKWLRDLILDGVVSLFHSFQKCGIVSLGIMIRK